MPFAAYGSLPFAEQAEFFRRKLNLPTDGWTDIWTWMHDYAFVVAGANRDAIVSDFRAAVEKAIAGGATLEDFRRDFDRIVATHGWDYNGGRNWRSRVIYDTNLSTSYAAGRWQQLQEAPYWQYEHQDWVQHPRPEHESWDGLVLERDDPWWQTHFPPNGWGCQCKVRGLWSRDLQKLGKSGPDQAPAVKLLEREIGQRSINGPRTVRVPEGIDPGFEYAPGRARLRSAIPPERPSPLIPGSAGGPGMPNRRPSAPLPPPRPVPATDLLPLGLEPQQYVDAYLGALGVRPGASAVIKDVIGERLVVGQELFTDAKGALKVTKRGREQYMLLLARALREPDEVWARVEWLHAQGRAVVRRRYVARFAVEGEPAPALAVFELGADGWSGVTTFQGVTQSEDEWRVGVLLYQRIVP
ncbi:PBECR2 nuclease fold domain-containing protein [Alicycliphilus denitrificans]|uniref:PBECR2 nuclease fold domain-containing protein n=1 Tax=Alicycliphilus denitrificans TaxID=179636 RepID=UPI0001D9F290|nr:PBECR2 nuclease fold domain-containing protein [Alicycliphilus denitrificans]ADU99822.1 head morphogenesis protein SPP1 gp7 [Alicycliphilus denitrificans BC]HRP19396.1 PBECR2 nuclease fold domain-containing protein [Alicycliphilus sp.]